MSHLLASTLSFFSSFLLSLYLIPRFIPFLTKYFLDLPTNRSSHLFPVPRAGGMIFVFVSLVYSLLNSFLHFSLFSIVPFLVLPLIVISVVDDKYHLPVGIRFLVQLITAILLLSISPYVSSFVVSHSVSASVFLIFVFLLACISFINFVNFMDGLDGLVAGTMLVAFLSLAFRSNLPFSVWALCASLLSFSFFNWSPALLFMGDVGSTFLGSVYAGFVLLSSDTTTLIGSILIVSPLFFDATLTVVMRFYYGQSVTAPHRLHLYQRLQQAGWSHSLVSSTYVILTILISLFFNLFGLTAAFMSSLFTLIFGYLLNQRFAVPFRAD